MNSHVTDSIQDKIETYGWSCIGVFDPDGEHPSFTYTVGLAAHGGAEYMIVGLDPRQAATVLNDIGARLTDGERFDEYSDSLLISLRVRFVDMTDEHQANMARDFWWDNEVPLRVRQVLWPDPQGRLPGEAGVEAIWVEPQRTAGSAF